MQLVLGRDDGVLLPGRALFVMSEAIIAVVKIICLIRELVDRICLLLRYCN